MSNYTVKGNERSVLEALQYLTTPGEICADFDTIQNQTGFPRDLVRPYCQILKFKGLAEFHCGLINDDGQLGGAGYCISKEGVEYLS